jgi:hypothetical protein
MDILVILVCAASAIIPGLLDRFRNRVGSFLPILAGASPLIFMRMFEGKIPLPSHEISAWIMWPFLWLSCPLFICSAVAFSNAKSLKARNASIVGSIVGALMSFYTWSGLWGFGAA